MPKPTKDKEIADLKADIAVALKIHGQMGEFNKKIVIVIALKQNWRSVVILLCGTGILKTASDK